MIRRVTVPALERMPLTRAVARRYVLDAARWPAGAIVLRVASDEVLVLSNTSIELSSDPHAIVTREDGFAGLWLSTEQAESFLERACEWELPRTRPAFA